jgi:Trypsin
MKRGGQDVRRSLTVLTAAVAALMIGLVPASAITDGTPDQEGHPYVGLMVAKSTEGAPLWRCSGTLMSPTVFMVAGHCTEAPAAEIEIWFDSGYPTPIPLATGFPAAGSNPCAGITGYPCTGDATGEPHTHPLYDPDAFFLHDLGVVTLESAVTGRGAGALPNEGELNTIRKQDATFTAVGYGLQKSFPPAASWKNEAIRTRMVAHPKLIQINQGIVGDFAMLLTNNHRTGGTCFGDSGGPNFIGNSNVVGGVTSFGLNQTCAGTGGVYRVDQPDDLGWLATFGLTPS